MELEEKIGYTFKNKRFLRVALTRRSYCIEHRTGEYNQRLEFLGDSVLGLAIAEEIYKRFPHIKEGELTRLKASAVCEKSLAVAANELKLSEYLNIGRGELMLGIQKLDSTTSDTLEAVFGAVLLDSGYDTAKKVILRVMKKQLEHAVSVMGEEDSKSALQELVQKKSKEDLVYTLVSEVGPEHNKRFVSSVSHKGKVLGTGEGKTKKESEKQAARMALHAFSYLYK